MMNTVPAPPPNITVTPAGFELGRSGVALSTSHQHQHVPKTPLVTSSTLQCVPQVTFTDFPSLRICQIDIPNGSVSSDGSVGITARSRAPKKSSMVKLNAGTPKQCGVCGDKATGRHYNALTCEGCKGFFRRYVNTGKKFPCLRGTLGHCTVSKSMRKTCRGCRLEKCLDLGMKSYPSGKFKGTEIPREDCATPTSLAGDDSISSCESFNIIDTVTGFHATSEAISSVRDINSSQQPLPATVSDVFVPHNPEDPTINLCLPSVLPELAVYSSEEYYPLQYQFSSLQYSPGFGIPSVHPMVSCNPAPNGGDAQRSEGGSASSCGVVENYDTLPCFPCHQVTMPTPATTCEDLVCSNPSDTTHYILSGDPRNYASLEGYGSHTLCHLEELGNPLFPSELELIESVIFSDGRNSAALDCGRPNMPPSRPQEGPVTCKTTMYKNISLFSGCITSHFTST